MDIASYDVELNGNGLFAVLFIHLIGTLFYSHANTGKFVQFLVVSLNRVIPHCVRDQFLAFEVLDYFFIINIVFLERFTPKSNHFYSHY